MCRSGCHPHVDAVGFSLLLYMVFVKAHRHGFKPDKQMTTQS